MFDIIAPVKPIFGINITFNDKSTIAISTVDILTNFKPSIPAEQKIQS